MAEGIPEKLPVPEEGPRYKFLVIQLDPGGKPELKIAKGLYGSLEGREPQIEDYTHLVVSELHVPTKKQMEEERPELAEKAEEEGKLAREMKADELLEPEKFFKEPLKFYSAIIITGSPFAAYPRATPEGVPYLTKWKRELIAYLRVAVEQEIPILGICGGEQILAEALGGKTERMKTKKGKEVWEWGWSKVYRTPGSVGDLVMKGLPSEFVAAQNRKDCISRLPPGAVLLAENEYGVQGFRLDDERERPLAWGLQFHPERPAEVVNEMLDREKHPKHLQKLREAGLDPDKIAELGKSFRPELMQRIFANFLDFVRGRIHG